MNENFDCCEERDAAKSLVQWKSAVRSQVIVSGKEPTNQIDRHNLVISSQYGQSGSVTTRARSIAVVNPEDFCSDLEAA